MPRVICSSDPCPCNDVESRLCRLYGKRPLKPVRDKCFLLNPPVVYFEECWWLLVYKMAKDCDNDEDCDSCIVADYCPHLNNTLREVYKTCPKCGMTYPASLEFFHRDSQNKDELTGWCKSCRRKREREWQKEYYQRPEIKAKRQKYNKEWYKKPENKEKKRAYNRERWRKKQEEAKL
jgi:hypothetical protein